MPDFAVILPAAGKAVRFGGDKNKLLYDLDGASVIRRSIGAFLIRKDVKRIIIPTSDTRMDLDIRDEIRDPRIEFSLGGACRAESVRKAVLPLMVEPRVWPERNIQVEWVAVHDAARPLVSQNLIDLTLAAAVEHGAAAPALPVALTIKEAAGELPAKVIRTVPRQDLWAMQTPQIMRLADLDAAFKQCPVPLEQVTDDVQLLELAGRPVWLVPGEQRNVKITTPADLELAKYFLENPESSYEPRP